MVHDAGPGALSVPADPRVRLVRRTENGGLSAARNTGLTRARGRYVTFLDDEAYRAGKHHFGAINTTDFLGKGLRAEYALPNQGYGGATTLVSYADAAHPGQVFVVGDQ